MSTAVAARRVHIETFGCQMNASDTEVVLARLAEHGYALSDGAEDADLILYNTCAVRDGAEAKVRGRLDALKPIKRARPELRIGVLGCMAQRVKGGEAAALAVKTLDARGSLKHAAGAAVAECAGQAFAGRQAARVGAEFKNYAHNKLLYHIAPLGVIATY